MPPRGGCGSNQWYHFGVGAPPILVYFRGDWDVYWGYWILTHGQVIHFDADNFERDVGQKHLNCLKKGGVEAEWYPKSGNVVIIGPFDRVRRAADLVHSKVCTARIIDLPPKYVPYFQLGWKLDGRNALQRELNQMPGIQEVSSDAAGVRMRGKALGPRQLFVQRIQPFRVIEMNR